MKPKSYSLNEQDSTNLRPDMPTKARALHYTAGFTNPKLKTLNRTTNSHLAADMALESKGLGTTV